MRCIAAVSDNGGFPTFGSFEEVGLLSIALVGAPISAEKVGRQHDDLGCQVRAVTANEDRPDSRGADCSPYRAYVGSLRIPERLRRAGTGTLGGARPGGG